MLSGCVKSAPGGSKVVKVAALEDAAMQTAKTARPGTQVICVRFMATPQGDRHQPFPEGPGLPAPAAILQEKPSGFNRDIETWPASSNRCDCRKNPRPAQMK